MVVFGGDSSTDQSLNLWPPPDLPALGGGYCCLRHRGIQAPTLISYRLSLITIMDLVHVALSEDPLQTRTKPGPCAAVKQSIITHAADNEIYSLCPSNLSNSPS